VRWKNCITCFKRVGCVEKCAIWRGKEKMVKYLYFDQFLVLPHVEVCTRHSDLSTPSSENEEDGDTSRGEEKEVP
jgi:hypothetical protein